MIQHHILSLLMYWRCPRGIAVIVFLLPVFRTLSFSLLDKVINLVLELNDVWNRNRGYNILSIQAVTGTMVPFRPNYGNEDTCNNPDPQGAAESTTSPAARLLVNVEISDLKVVKPSFTFLLLLHTKYTRCVFCWQILIVIIEHRWFGACSA